MACPTLQYARTSLAVRRRRLEGDATVLNLGNLLVAAAKKATTAQIAASASLRLRATS